MAPGRTSHKPGSFLVRALEAVARKRASKKQEETDAKECPVKSHSRFKSIFATSNSPKAYEETTLHLLAPERPNITSDSSYVAEQQKELWLQQEAMRVPSRARIRPHVDQPVSRPVPPPPVAPTTPPHAPTPPSMLEPCTPPLPSSAEWHMALAMGYDEPHGLLPDPTGRVCSGEVAGQPGLQALMNAAAERPISAPRRRSLDLTARPQSPISARPVGRPSQPAAAVAPEQACLLSQPSVSGITMGQATSTSSASASACRSVHRFLSVVYRSTPGAASPMQAERSGVNGTPAGSESGELCLAPGAEPAGPNAHSLSHNSQPLPLAGSSDVGPAAASTSQAGFSPFTTARIEAMWPARRVNRRASVSEAFPATVSAGQIKPLAGLLYDPAESTYDTQSPPHSQNLSRCSNGGLVTTAPRPNATRAGTARSRRASLDFMPGEGARSHEHSTRFTWLQSSRVQPELQGGSLPSEASRAVCSNNAAAAADAAHHNPHHPNRQGARNSHYYGAAAARGLTAAAAAASCCTPAKAASGSAELVGRLVSDPLPATGRPAPSTAWSAAATPAGGAAAAGPCSSPGRRVCERRASVSLRAVLPKHEQDLLQALEEERNDLEAVKARSRLAVRNMSTLQRASLEVPAGVCITQTQDWKYTH